MTQKAIQEFWSWFRKRAPRLAEMYEANMLEELGEEVNRRLDTISGDLPWEVGPGRRKKYSLTLSPEGNPQLSILIQQMLDEAPNIHDWELYSSRQPRPPSRAIQLPERGLDFPTDQWRFIPEEDLATNRVHLKILDRRLASEDREAALKAVSIFLDQFLGEEMVERWIGMITVAKSSARRKSHPISELLDYIVTKSKRERNL
ncbi:MAG: hypothetical protein ACRD2Q_00135 [Terriglobales bacterium]